MNFLMKGILMSEYKNKYCKKHDQWFAEFIPTCPICLGEELGDLEIAEKAREAYKKQIMKDKGI